MWSPPRNVVCLRKKKQKTNDNRISLQKIVYEKTPELISREISMGFSRESFRQIVIFIICCFHSVWIQHTFLTGTAQRSCCRAWIGDCIPCNKRCMCTENLGNTGQYIQVLTMDPFVIPTGFQIVRSCQFIRILFAAIVFLKEINQQSFQHSLYIFSLSREKQMLQSRNCLLWSFLTVLLIIKDLYSYCVWDLIIIQT